MNKNLFFALLAVLLAASYPTRAQVQLIAHPDQDSTRLPGIYSVFYEFSGKAFFSARDNIGSALYCTDGTTGGTTFITRDFYPEGFTSCGDWLYVFGSKAQYDLPWWNPFGQYAIWRMKADGSERQKLVDLYKPYSMYAHSFYLWSADNRVFFSWREGLSWIDNDTGTVTNVFQGLKRETEGLVDFGLEQKAMARNGVFFMGQGNSLNNFYYTDLTLDNTMGLARIQTGGTSVPMDQMRVVNDRCYVLHTADTMQLWSSDGTPGGTSAIWQNTQFVAWQNPFTPTFLTFNNELIMVFPEKVNDTIWHSIYTCSDDSVKLLYRHPVTYYTYPEYYNLIFVSHPDGLYVFIKNPQEAHQWEVWLKDNAGYRQVTSIELPDGLSSISSIKWLNGQFIILAGKTFIYDDQNFTLQFTSEITGSSFYQTSLGVFFTHTKDQQVLEPWVIKTDPPSCTLLKELITDLKYGSISNLTTAGDQLYFSANTKEYGTEVWVTGGQAATTRLTKDVNAAGNAQPDDLIPYLNRLIFSVPGNYSYTGLWTSDGTTDGTTKLEDLVIREDDKWCTKVVWKDKICFAGKPKSSAVEDWYLYISDGTPGEARPLDDAFTDQHFTSVFSLAVAGDLLYFINDGLWATDGTEAGTRSIDAFIGGDDQYDYGIYFGNEMCASGSKLYFTRDRFTGNPSRRMREVWVTDGTAEGTKCVADFGDDFSKNQLMKFLGIHKGNLVFTYSTPGNGFELWSSDGDSAHTVQLTGKQDTKSDNDKQFTEGVALGDQFFFVAFTEENGYELWVTDETAVGTHIFMELARGQQSTYPKGLSVAGNKLFFFTETGGIGLVLWITDGTLAGTEALPWDFDPLNNIGQVVFWKNSLYFIASHPDTGKGLYRYDLSEVLGTKEIENPGSEIRLSLYPNPSSADLTIQLSGQKASVIYGYLLSQDGRIIKEFSMKNGNKTLSVKELDAGIYFIKIGEASQAFIKQ